MKENVLKCLKESKDDYVSGEYLSDIFGVTRSAVWKVIKQLQEEGYVIESKTKAGYKLTGVPDNLYPYEIQEGLSTKRIGRVIHYFDEIQSTNDYGKKLADEGFEDGEVIIAESQQGGRGRFSREWISPKKKGAYFSILLRPEISFEKITRLSMISATAVSVALERHLQMPVQIKWPNDILLNGKKICGILTEINGEMDKINYAIVGIGININLDLEDLGENLTNKASSLKIETGEVQNRKAIVQKILNSFDQYYDDFLKDENFQKALSEYREKSCLIGREIRITESNGKTGLAKVLDIEETGALKVEMKNGDMRSLLSGEVSLSGNY